MQTRRDVGIFCGGRRLFQCIARLHQSTTEDVSTVGFADRFIYFNGTHSKFLGTQPHQLTPDATPVQASGSGILPGRLRTTPPTIAVHLPTYVAGHIED